MVKSEVTLPKVSHILRQVTSLIPIPKLILKPYDIKKEIARGIDRIMEESERNKAEEKWKKRLLI